MPVESGNNYLVANGQEYKGQYVTVCGPDSKEIVSASTSAVEAVRSAKAAGCETPVLIYVPADHQRHFIF